MPCRLMASAPTGLAGRVEIADLKTIWNLQLAQHGNLTSEAVLLGARVAAGVRCGAATDS